MKELGICKPQKDMTVAKKMVSIMIPCYNEQESLRALYSELTKTLSPIDNYSFELLFINDGSHDKTLQIIEESEFWQGKCDACWL